MCHENTKRPQSTATWHLWPNMSTKPVKDCSMTGLVVRALTRVTFNGCCAAWKSYWICQNPQEVIVRGLLKYQK